MEKIQDFSVNRDEMKDQTNEDVIEEVEVKGMPNNAEKGFVDYVLFLYV